MSESKDELLNLIVEFCMSTIVGQESGIYKGASSGVNKNILLTDLSKPSMTNTMVMFICHYINSCYKSLILKDDQYVTDKFAEMISIKNHSPVCLFGFILHIAKTTYEVFNREAFDTSSYESYMKSVKKQTFILRLVWLVRLSGAFNHQCVGLKIEDCDPNEPFVKLTQKS